LAQRHEKIVSKIIAVDQQRAGYSVAIEVMNLWFVKINENTCV
jgi:hypothetical protein